MYDWFTAGRNPFFFQLQAIAGGHSASLILSIDHTGSLSNDKLGTMTIADIIETLSAWMAQPDYWSI